MTDTLEGLTPISLRAAVEALPRRALQSLAKKQGVKVGAPAAPQGRQPPHPPDSQPPPAAPAACCRRPTGPPTHPSPLRRLALLPGQPEERCAGAPTV